MKLADELLAVWDVSIPVDRVIDVATRGQVQTLFSSDLNEVSSPGKMTGQERLFLNEGLRRVAAAPVGNQPKNRGVLLLIHYILRALLLDAGTQRKNALLTKVGPTLDRLWKLDAGGATVSELSPSFLRVKRAVEALPDYARFPL
jgi:hypothetical protein